MAEKDLPERLQLQNERIQEIENKIKKLEDKEQDGKYLVSLKEKLVTEEKAKGDIENIYSLSAIEIAEIKAKAKQKQSLSPFLRASSVGRRLPSRPPFSPRLHRPHILLLYRSGCGRNGSRSRTPGICRKSAGARLASRLSALPWTIPARASSRSVPTGFSGGGTSPSPSSIG